MQKHFTQAPEQNDWKEFKPLFGSGKIKLCDTLRAVTPFGGLSLLIEFLGRIELVGQLNAQVPYQVKSPNHFGDLYFERICRSPAFCSCQPYFDDQFRAKTRCQTVVDGA